MSQRDFYSPDQPRGPKGHPTGGEFVDWPGHGEGESGSGKGAQSSDGMKVPKSLAGALGLARSEIAKVGLTPNKFGLGKHTTPYSLLTHLRSGRDQMKEVMLKQTQPEERDAARALLGLMNKALKEAEKAFPDAVGRFSADEEERDYMDPKMKKMRPEDDMENEDAEGSEDEGMEDDEDMPEDEDADKTKKMMKGKKADCSEDDDAHDYAHRTIEGVEIFKVGNWNGDAYSESDLDKIVEAYSAVGFTPPVKVGHVKDPAARAYGWVRNVRRKGAKLLADFHDVPEEIYSAIKDRAFDAVSSEIFWNLKRDGKVFPRALKAVALLGAEVPAVSGLAPLREVVHQTIPVAGFDRVSEYTIQPEEWNMAEIAELQKQLAELQRNYAAEVSKNDALSARVGEMEEQKRKETVAKKVEAVTVPALRTAFHALYDLASRSDATKVAEYAQGDKTLEVNTEAALDLLVAQINQTGAKLFAELSAAGDKTRPERSAFDNPALEVDKRTREHMAKNGVKDYNEAMSVVLNADPALKTAYAKVA